MKKLKSSFKFIIGIVVGLLIGGTTVFAINILSSDVSFSPKDDQWQVEDVESALNDLYSKANVNQGGYYEILGNNSACSGTVAPPTLDQGLIPVVISDTGEVTYADTSKTWYDYCNKIWANAVKLVTNPSKTYTVGSIIEEKDIESYFVWIPKYKYKLWNTGRSGDVQLKTRHLIDIVFDTNNTTDIEGVSCKTPMTSGASGNCNNGEYMTHPAFISMEVNGFWVGKFETGYKDATSTSAAQNSTNTNKLNVSQIVIKPDMYSWRKINVENAFKNSYEYIVKDSKHYSHLIKNTEWGAVAYLSHSKYGIGTEINVNNNSAYKTGYSALPSTYQLSPSPTTCSDGSCYKAYNTEIGYLASTTGNITGIYDMSGGSMDFVASYVANAKDFASNYDSKYFDEYKLSNTSNYINNRILGDATGEMGPFYSETNGGWYNDNTAFISSGTGKFARGGAYYDGVIAGQFSYTRGANDPYAHVGFRIVVE